MVVRQILDLNVEVRALVRQQVTRNKVVGFVFPGATRLARRRGREGKTARCNRAGSLGLSKEGWIGPRTRRVAG